ncbi:MAG: DUF1552 domain-containing protein [Alphaproteobacteria bacterium]|nr:DUF1552 domain-containing protein [Alphaproteobacteria bacterium]
MNRRHFLQALGLSTASLSLGRPAWSLDSAPKRLIVVSSTHGAVYDGWKTNPAGLPDDQPWSQDLVSAPESAFGPALRPLYEHRRRLLIPDGVSLVSAELDGNGERHAKGWLHAWTGGYADFLGGGLSATAPSFDQLVARSIARADRLTSLELSVLGGRPICHGGPGQQLPLEDRPERAFSRIFGIGTSGDPLVDARSSVLDYVLAEHHALAPRLAARDREKLDAHFDLVRQLEIRLSGLAAAGCDGPSLAPATDHRTTFQAHAELVAAAFACDLTRVATLSLGDVPTAEFGWGSVGSGDAHNDFAHAIYENPQAAQAMIDYQRFQAEEIAALVRALEAVPEGDGTLMDHTLIVWGNELGDGWHGYGRYSPVLIGGEWFFRTGRVVHWPWDSVPISVVTPYGQSAGAGIPHQRVLVSAARAMGLDVDHVGLASIDDDSGVPLDLRGTLQELT